MSYVVGFYLQMYFGRCFKNIGQRKPEIIQSTREMGRNWRSLAVMEFKIKSLQNTLESVSGHYESIFWECCEMAPSWERISGKCHSRAFFILPYHCLPGAVTELRRWGERQKERKGGKEGKEREGEGKKKRGSKWEKREDRKGPAALIGHYRDSSRSKGLCVHGTICFIRRNHAVRKLVWNTLPGTSEMGGWEIIRIINNNNKKKNNRRKEKEERKTKEGDFEDTEMEGGGPIISHCIFSIWAHEYASEYLSKHYHWHRFPSTAYLCCHAYE